MTTCPICRPKNDESTLLWSDSSCRVILCNDTDYPGFCRVIWRTHVTEMTDLSPAERAHFMAVVWDVETVLRNVMRPDKINLASFGNQVPHLHWHVIPRFTDDRHFPESVWGETQRPGRPHSVDPERLKKALATLRVSAE